MDMISNRPYLLRAFYDWIVDSQCTPVLVADPRHPRCKIPFDYTDDNEVVLNLSPNAVRDLDISNSLVQFRASFNGIVHLITIPISAVLALYADENNEGIFFEGPEETLASLDGIADTHHANFSLSALDKQHQAESDMPASLAERHAPKTRPVLKLVEVE